MPVPGGAPWPALRCQLPSCPPSSAPCSCIRETREGWQGSSAGEAGSIWVELLGCHHRGLQASSVLPGLASFLLALPVLCPGGSSAPPSPAEPGLVPAGQQVELPSTAAFTFRAQGGPAERGQGPGPACSSCSGLGSLLRALPLSADLLAPSSGTVLWPVRRLLPTFLLSCRVCRLPGDFPRPRWVPSPAAPLPLQPCSPPTVPSAGRYPWREQSIIRGMGGCRGGSAAPLPPGLVPTRMPRGEFTTWAAAWFCFKTKSSLNPALSETNRVSPCVVPHDQVSSPVAPQSLALEELTLINVSINELMPR